MVVRAGSILFVASLLFANSALAASASAGDRLTIGGINSDISAQTRPRPRVRIYGGTHQLPPNAVRQCRAWYVQEHRVSGTYVVPRMQCWWEY